MDKTISYVDFVFAWKDWQEFYWENNPCPHAVSGDCPDPCPVPDKVRTRDAIRLWNKWWKTLPDDHWLKDREILENVEWLVVEGGKE